MLELLQAMSKTAKDIPSSTSVRKVANESSSAETASSSSILKRLVKEAIIAYPEDAHLKILDFLSDGGMNDESTLKFRQSWSKVVMGTQAFGRKKNAKDVAIPNPDLFADELIRELSYGDREISQLINLMTSGGDLAEQNENIDNPHEILKTLNKSNTINRRLINTIQELNDAPKAAVQDTAADHSLVVHQAMAMFRNSLKGTKIHWKSSKTVNVPYYPLDKSLHGDPESYHGSLSLPSTKNDHKEMPLYLSTTELQGLRVTSLQPCFQERAWSSYQCLNEMLACHSLNPFPLPVGAHREHHSLSVMMAFESLPVKLLHSLEGPVLSTFLRKHPSIISLWAGQLAAAYYSLLHHCSGSLVRPVSISRDVYVRENGMLLLGNVGFNDTAPKKDARGGNKNAADFLLMMGKLLSTVLCLSRTETVTLQDAAGPMATEREDDFRRSTVSMAAEPGMNEIVFAVVAGSSLELTVLGHKCTAVNVIAPRTVSSEQSRKIKHENKSSSGRSSGGGRAGGAHEHENDDEDDAAASREVVEEEEEDTKYSSASTGAASTTGGVKACSVLTVRVKAEHAGVASVRPTADPLSSGANGGASRGAAAGSSVTVQTHKAGVISLQLSAYRQDDEEQQGGDVGGGYSRRCVCTVRVVVIPNYPVESVEALELIGFLEEYHLSRIPSSILNAQVFSHRRLERLKKEVSEDNSDSALEYYRQNNLLAASATVRRKNFLSEWAEIERAIHRLGTQNLADATLTSAIAAGATATTTSNVGTHSVLLRDK